MFCKKCGGLLEVIRVEPENSKNKLDYQRLCDVQCINTECKTTYYSQPYDFGRAINPVRKLNEQYDA